MGMFNKSITAENFGKLTSEGHSKVWETMVSMSGFESEFLLRVHGTESGPTEAQCDAYGALFRNSENLRQIATQPTIDYLYACGIVPQEINLNANNLWTYLSPSFIEVNDNNEYDAGAGPAESIAISVGFQVPWDQANLLQIGVINGTLDNVY